MSYKKIELEYLDDTTTLRAKFIGEKTDNNSYIENQIYL